MGNTSLELRPRRRIDPPTARLRPGGPRGPFYSRPIRLVFVSGTPDCNHWEPSGVILYIPLEGRFTKPALRRSCRI